MKNVIIIAEAGVNHNGSLTIAKELIDAAASAGADFVKFQTFKASSLVTRYADKAEYQKKLTRKSETHFDMIKKLELNKSSHLDLINYSKKKGIEFLSSPFDLDSVNLLNELKIPFFKIPSGEITNLPYIRHIAKLNKPVVMSTGMATLNEVERSINILINEGLSKDNLAVLHCNTEYPTPFSDVNLKAMITMREKFGLKVGYSDHTLGIEASIAAVALGARIIEKHFTMDRKLIGPDHAASLQPKELKKMIESIRNIEKALGDGNKKPSQSEIKNISIARKSIVALKQIDKGEIFSEKNLTVKRPGKGISPFEWDNLIGKRAIKDFVKDELIVE